MGARGEGRRARGERQRKSLGRGGGRTAADDLAQLSLSPSLDIPGPVTASVFAALAGVADTGVQACALVPDTGVSKYKIRVSTEACVVVRGMLYVCCILLIPVTQARLVLSGSMRGSARLEFGARLTAGRCQAHHLYRLLHQGKWM